MCFENFPLCFFHPVFFSKENFLNDWGIITEELGASEAYDIFQAGMIKKARLNVWNGLPCEGRFDAHGLVAEEFPGQNSKIRTEFYVYLCM